MKLGLFGGSFDPVHNGHMALAKAALRELGLDRIYFVPAARPPHKRHLRLTPAVHRLGMLKAAARSTPSFIVSPWEIRRRGLSYTERTLRAFRRRFPRAEWHLIVGGDSFRDFTSWRRWRDLLKNSRLVVGLRRGVDPGPVPKELGGRVTYLQARLPDVSSTEVRERLARKRSIAGLVPPPAARYIRRCKLYGAGGR